MAKNLGTVDRLLRLAGAVGVGIAAVQAPAPLLVRLTVLAGTSAYLLGSALAGTCVGYRLMGKSTCGVEQRT